ncbi:hypothetical protein IFM89_010945 [Coptis chinensis]|uniref:Uncharacterized protein n=1 Tax=Coptis chinensis TaxID=261450 RepID=A0A835IJP4_9MAGN|nr:hypothetical protein IFM89_010945 [Coptis chinensis]
MAFLFASSAAVQLNDPDWYLWFPLYTTASLVNLLRNTSTSRTVKQTAKLAFWLGTFLFLKVVIEDYVDELAGFGSLNLEERVVREKVGSGLVMISMLLHLEVSVVSEYAPCRSDLCRDLNNVGEFMPMPLLFLAHTEVVVGTALVDGDGTVGGIQLWGSPGLLYVFERRNQTMSIFHFSM